MFHDSDMKRMNRLSHAQDIDRDPVGSRLTPEARERAIDFAEKAFTGNTNRGTAVQLGIQHVTSDVFKK